MRNVIPVSIELNFIDRGSNAGLKKAEGSVKQLGKTAASTEANFKNLAGAFTSMVVANKLAGTLNAIVEPARKMEISMMRLGWLTGKTTTELSAMRKVADDVAKTTVFGPQEAADAMSQLVRATGSADIAMKALGSTASLAMASFGKLTLEKSAKMVTDLAKSFSMSEDEIAKSGDKLMAITKATGVGIEELRDIMGYLGTAAIRGGQSFDEMLKSFSLARRVLPSSRRAATQLQRVMGEITTQKAQDAFGKIGIRLADASGKARQMSDVMMDMAQVNSMAPLQVRDALNAAFGEAAVKPMLAMLSQLQNGMKTMSGETLRGAGVFRYLQNTLDSSTGAVDKANKKYMATAEAGIQQMDEAWVKLKTTLGEAVLPELGKIAKALADLLGGIVDVFKALGPFGQWFFKSVMLFGTATVAVMAFRMAWVGANAVLQAAISYTAGVATLGATSTAATAATITLSGAFKSLWAIIAANPIGLLLMLIPTLISGLNALSERVKKERAKMMPGLATQEIGRNKQLQAIWNNKDQKEAMKDWTYFRQEEERKLNSFFLSDSGLSQHVGVYTKEGTKELLAVMDKMMKARLTNQQKLAKMQEDLQKALHRRDEAHVQKIKNVLMMGTKPFEDAIDKLTGAFKRKTSVVDAKALGKIDDMLLQIAKAKPGQLVNGVAVKEHEIARAQELRGKTGLRGFTETVGKGLRGKSVSGTESGMALGKMVDTKKFMDKIFVGKAGDKLVELFDATAGALGRSLSEEARGDAMTYLRGTGGKGVATGTGPTSEKFKSFQPVLGDFVPNVNTDIGQADFIRRIAGKDPNVHFAAGGRGGLPGSTLLPEEAAALGRGNLFGPEATQQLTQTSDREKMLSELPVMTEQLAADKEIKDLKIGIAKLAQELTKVNQAVSGVRTDGVKLKRDYDPALQTAFDNM